MEVNFRKGVTSYGKGGKLSELTSNKHWLQGKKLISLHYLKLFGFKLIIQLFKSFSEKDGE